MNVGSPPAARIASSASASSSPVVTPGRAASRSNASVPAATAPAAAMASMSSALRMVTTAAYPLPAVRSAVNATMRKGILGLARSPRASAFVHRYGARLGARRFVAGETLDDALDVLARLNARGLHANTTLLGEDVQTPAEAGEVVSEYEQILDALVERGLKANV